MRNIAAGNLWISPAFIGGISSSARYCPMMSTVIFQIDVRFRGPSEWAWQVLFGKYPIVHGIEETEKAARLKSESVRTLLVAAKWLPPGAINGRQSPIAL
jgi:hypothetical protein